MTLQFKKSNAQDAIKSKKNGFEMNEMVQLSDNQLNEVKGGGSYYYYDADGNRCYHMSLVIEQTAE